ncbi:MAG: DUF3014 domain-containing protein [Xanthomonadales bacterium]|nr:DUF3014 domain-containing protein [Xanthomonadales bacterium]
MRWFVSIIIVLALVAGLWWMEQKRQAALVPEARLDIPAEAEQPEPRYPLPKPERHPAPSPDSPTGEREAPRQPAEPAREPQPPLPELAGSDETALDALAGLFGSEFVEQRIKPEFVISRTVAIVNSLEGAAPALKTWPVDTLDPEPATEAQSDGDTLHWTQENTERYDTWMNALETLPPEEAAALYARYYPLFQQAWNELGETEPHFNDRLIDIVDHLLATPEIGLPIEVIPYEGRLQFADEALEEQSWGRKLLIRMGPAHADKVTDWLRAFRRAVIQSPSATQSVPGTD